VTPVTRVVGGVAGLAAATAAVRRDRVGRREARVFASVNELPDSLHAPAWLVMQCGALAAAPAAGIVAWRLGERRLGAHLVAAGTSTWALSKVVKRAVRRERPVGLLPAVRVRGASASGLGYLSGHAGVATALASAVVAKVGARRATPALVVAGLVGATRVYVGAHLPLDIVGGVALGVVVEGGLSHLGAGVRR
jgi:undecaprenyl-diphosphatase